MFTFVGTCRRHGCYADDGVGLGLGWGCSRSLELAHAMDVTLMMGVGMFTFVGTCTRHGCYADDGVGLGLGWGCSRSLELAHAMDVTLMMGWGWGWGGVVHIRVHTGSLDAYWTLMKDGIPKSLSSHCAEKPNPKLWKYIKIQQWHWEMGTCQLLSKTGRQLAML